MELYYSMPTKQPLVGVLRHVVKGGPMGSMISHTLCINKLGSALGRVGVGGDIKPCTQKLISNSFTRIHVITYTNTKLRYHSLGYLLAISMQWHKLEIVHE
jgi:hypothetical protein